MTEKRKYDNSRRAEKAAQRRLRKALEYERRLQRIEERRRRREERAARHHDLELPRDFACPRCGKIKPRRVSWRVGNDGQTVCLTCFMSGQKLPADLNCPRCGRHVSHRSHWAVKEPGGPVCRKCVKERKVAERAIAQGGLDAGNV